MKDNLPFASVLYMSEKRDKLHILNKGEREVTKEDSLNDIQIKKKIKTNEGNGVTHAQAQK